jgi:hypothetical protein
VVAVTDGLPKKWDWVRDRERPEEPMLVVEVFEDRTATDHHVRGKDATVADLNPDYPDDSPVVKVVYPSSVRDHGLHVEDFGEIYAAARRLDLTSYSFPAPRLRPVRGGEADE